MIFFFSSRRRHTRWNCDWSSDVCSSDLLFGAYMVFDWVRNQRSVDEDNDALLTRPRVIGTAAATTGSGFLSGAMGIGGGLLNVPLLVYVLGRKTRKAIGTSSPL